MIKPRVEINILTKPNKIIYTCQACGSEDVEVKAWWDPNKNKFIEIIDGETEGWCRYCDENNIITNL